MLFKKILLLSILGLTGTCASAQALLLNDNNLRSDLNWLNQQGVIALSTSTWPISADAVSDALSHAVIKNSAQKKVLDAVSQKLQPQAFATAQINVATAQNRLPASFSETASNAAQYNAGLTLQQSRSNWDIHLQTNVEAEQRISTNNKLNLNGSYAAGKLWNQWLIVGDIPVWWGPGHDGSLIRGDATRPVAGFSAQRAQQQAFETKWLSWLGPWQYQLFAGQLQHYTALPQTKLLGMRVTIQPFSFLELGASRSIQWGGKNRDEGLSTLWKATIGQDNVYGNTLDPSNQLGGFDARLNLQPLLQLPVGIYGQLVGEDEAGKLPSRNLYLAGLDFSSSYQGLPYQIYAEWADTRTSGKVWGYTYNHHVYRGGYYEYGYPLGHAMGGDGQMYSIGGNIQLDATNRVNTRLLYAKVDQSNTVNQGVHINKAFPVEDTIKALQLGWVNTFKPGYEVQLNGWVGHSESRHFDNGVSLGVKFPLVF
ncbi:capsule assembly Wzi family protein [Acinetobacter rathckeae]|uniref:capsule assembly Wzi family protein n=1 Tax=Acinetobacter rathckeae TaxID=2605272 RepID=UPI0018A30370|nr:capsule assembly Wzi family protein [Acinetobacter rathckeae]MBF7688998.1 capsule assembly Wzi family protein [Acinetobacter rathckeae]